MGLPPVGDEGAVAVVAGLEGADAVMLGIGGDRLLQVAGAHVVDGPLLPGLDLPAVHGQLGGAQAEAEGAEAAAGGDGGELAVVADQHHLGPGPLGMARAGGRACGCRPWPPRPPPAPIRPSSSSPAAAEVEQEPVDRAGIGEAFVGQADGGDPGRGGAEDLVAVQLERLPGQPQRPGLARPGPPDHHRHPGAALGEVTDHGRLVLPGGGVAVQDLADHLRPDHGAALARPGSVAPSTSCRSRASSSGVENRSTPRRRSWPTRTARSARNRSAASSAWVSASCGARGDREALGQGVHHVGRG